MFVVSNYRRHTALIDKESAVFLFLGLAITRLPTRFILRFTGALLMSGSKRNP